MSSEIRFAGHVVAVGYDAGSGWLTVCLESAAWGAKLTLEQTRVIATANESASDGYHRALTAHRQAVPPR
ncbi:hypothetical protein [Streptomyces sp. NPDC048277]|uniref:hypothetical protein n=1 Tax=Streptomyces sp. NPDC048277 TaxID=3155027 RepID=UPI003407E8C0